MATFQATVAAGADDAHEEDDDTSFDGTATILLCDSDSSAGKRKNAGLRFLNVTIGNATITAATLTIYMDRSNEPIHVDILGEDVDDAVSFTSNADVTSRTRTTSSVAWNVNSPGLGTEVSPDISAIIQSIINRAGWASGNDMVIFLDGLTIPNDTTRFRSFENGSGADAVVLDITFTANSPIPLPLWNKRNQSMADHPGMI